MNKLLMVLGLLVSGFVGWYIGQREQTDIDAKIDANTVAIVNNNAISKVEFIDKMKSHGGLKAGQFHKLEQRESLLTFLINQEVIYSKAEAKGITNDETVMALYKKAVVDRYLELELKPLLAKAKVSSFDVKKYFEHNKQSYERPARRRAAIIYVATSVKDSDETRSKKKERIQEAYEKITELDEKTLHFGQLAKIYSDDRNSRYQGGVIGWLINHPSRHYKWDDQVLEQLFSLKNNGDHSPILETEKGYYIVRLVAKEKTQEKNLSRVEKGIKNSLLQKKKKQIKEDFIISLINAADIKINKNLLASIEPISKAASKNKKKPPALPGTGGNL